MARQSGKSGIRREVSPAIAVIIIVVVIVIACFIGFGGTGWLRMLGRSGYAHSEVNATGEIAAPPDTKRVAGERLGVTLSPQPPEGGGLPVLSVTPGSGTPLQQGDVITSIEGADIKGPAHMPQLVLRTNDIRVGQKIAVTVRRNGAVTQLQVPRLASSRSTQSGQQGMGAPNRLPDAR